MFVSQRSSNEEYLEKLTGRMLAYKAQGVTRFAFGDIFLEDLKRWREDNLAQLGPARSVPNLEGGFTRIDP